MTDFDFLSDPFQKIFDEMTPSERAEHEKYASLMGFGDKDPEELAKIQTHLMLYNLYLSKKKTLKDLAKEYPQLGKKSSLAEKILLGKVYFNGLLPLVLLIWHEVLGEIKAKPNDIKPFPPFLKNLLYFESLDKKNEPKEAKTKGGGEK